MIVLIFRLLWSRKHELVRLRHIRHGRIGVRSGDHESAAPEQPAIDEGSLTSRDGNRGHDSSDRRTPDRSARAAAHDLLPPLPFSMSHRLARTR